MGALSWIEQLGVGGLVIVAFVWGLGKILPTTIRALKNGRQDNSEAALRQIKDHIDERFRESVIPILNRQTDILDEMRQAMTKLVTLAEFQGRRK